MNFANAIEKRSEMYDFQEKRIVLVVGPGRSGTSAITRGLHVLGVELGQNLMPPEHGVNDKGFWEDKDVYNLNVEIFRAMDHDWDRVTPVPLQKLSETRFGELKLRAIELLRKKMDAVSCFGVKDPQMTRLLPFWRGIFAHLAVRDSYVIACRNPMSVARSLAKYTGFSLEKSYLLWFEHTLAALIETSKKSRVVVDYDYMLQDSATQLGRISNALNLRFDMEGAEFLEYQSQFLEAGLRHTEYEADDLEFEHAAPPKVRSLYQLMLKFASDRMPIDGEDAVAEIEQFRKLHFDDAYFLEQIQIYEDKLRASSRRLIEQDEQASQFNHLVAERDSLIANLGQTVESLVIDRDAQKAGLAQLHATFEIQAGERSEQVSQLNHLVAERDSLIANLGQTVESLVIDRDAQKAGLAQLHATFEIQAGERSEQVSQLNCLIAERDDLIEKLKQTVESLVIDRDAQQTGLVQLQGSYENSLRECDVQVLQLNRIVAERDERIETLGTALNAMLTSRSWRLTSPLRRFVQGASRVIHYVSHHKSRNPYVEASKPASEISAEDVECSAGTTSSEFRILLVSYYCPTRAHAGGLRILDIYALIKAQCPNVQIDLLTHHRPSIDWSLDDVQSLFDNVYMSPSEELTPDVLATVRGSPLTYDVIDLQFHQAGHQIDAFRRIGRKILFTPMESLAKVLFIELRSKHLKQHGIKLFRIASSIRAAIEEIAIVQKADEVICVSRSDAALLRTVAASRRVRGIDTGVSQFEFGNALRCDFTNANAAARPCRVLYIAYFGSETNLVALRWYLEHVHPLVKATIPNYIFTVVGRGDLSSFVKYSDSSIEFIGEVPAVAPYIEKARVGIAPALGGSGFRGKVNQYAVLGVPSVISPVASKGLAYRDGVNIFIAEEPRAFADRCIRLLTDFDLNDRMGKAARSLCIDRYSWESKWRLIRKVYELEKFS